MWAGAGRPSPSASTAFTTGRREDAGWPRSSPSVTPRRGGSCGSTAGSPPGRPRRRSARCCSPCSHQSGRDRRPRSRRRVVLGARRAGAPRRAGPGGQAGPVVREDGTVTSAADRIRVLIVDDHGLYRRGLQTVLAGADGYLLKSVIEDIAAGIRGVANGESQLSPAMATKLLLEFKQISTSTPAQPRTPALELRPSLTDREVDVLQRVAQGRLNREIADELSITENTVRSHIRNILDKLQMHTRMEAAMYAVRQRLIDPGVD